MSLTKNVHLNWYSSMKKNEKDFHDFWHRKLTLQVKLRHFLTPPHYTNSQNSIISFEYLSNFVPPGWKLNNPHYHSLGMSFVSNRERKYDMSCRTLLAEILHYEGLGRQGNEVTSFSKRAILFLFIKIFTRYLFNFHSLFSVW